MGLILSLDNSIHSFNTGKFVLDQYTGATAAYSLRRLSVNSTNVVRVRRSVDNAEDDFKADEITDGTLTSFVGGQNLCLQSEDINTTWTTPTGNATPTQSTEETPDGDTTNKYIRLADNGSTGFGQVNVAQSITVSGGTQYTASVFLKKDGLDWAALRARDTGGVDDDPIQYFDLDNGELGSGSAGIQDATIVEYPNDWYRCSITWTQGAGDTSFSFRIFVADNDNDITVDLDGTSSIFVWGAQLNEGSSAGDYVPTTSSIAGDGYVTTWYDQAGSNDATQATAANQPKIVDAGVLVEENGKSAIDFDGVNDGLNAASANLVTANSAYSVFTVGLSNTVVSGYYYWGINATDNGTGTGRAVGFTPEFAVRVTGNAIFSNSASGSQELLSLLYDGTTIQNHALYIDGINSAVSSSSSGSSPMNIANGDFRVGGWGPSATNSLDGNIQEVIIYPSDQSSNRVGIETNINDYYNIYP